MPTEADVALYADELDRCNTAIYGRDRQAARLAYVRAACLRRLGLDQAVTVLRQELILTLVADGPWFSGNVLRSWVMESNRLAYVARTAGLTSYRLPSHWEISNLIRRHFGDGATHDR